MSQRLTIIGLKTTVLTISPPNPIRFTIIHLISCLILSIAPSLDSNNLNLNFNSIFIQYYLPSALCIIVYIRDLSKSCILIFFGGETRTKVRNIEIKINICINISKTNNNNFSNGKCTINNFEKTVIIILFFLCCYLFVIVTQTQHK